MSITVNAHDLNSPPLNLAADMRDRARDAMRKIADRQIDAMFDAVDAHALAVEDRRVRLRAFSDDIEARIARGERFTAERLREMFDRFACDNPEPVDPNPWRGHGIAVRSARSAAL